jgi:hypothetical protein
VTEVRVRSAYDARAATLVDVYDLADLDDVLDTLRRWGIVDGGGTDLGADLMGQFVVTEGAAYFEIVVGGD